MADQKSKFMVGLFMMAGIAIGLTAIIWLGMSHFFEEGRYYATYFDQSVQGLIVDSPVKYRGVSIGRVDRINVAPDSHLITVVMKIDSGITMQPDMIAQLKVVGITGSMFIEIDRSVAGEMELSPKISFPSQYPVIASKPSEISRIFQGLDDIVHKFNTLNIEKIAQEFTEMLQTVTTSVEELQVDLISEQTILALDNLNKNLDSTRWDRIIQSLDKGTSSIPAVVDEMNEVIHQVNALAQRIDSVIEVNEGTVNSSLLEFNETLESSRKFVSNASNLAANAEKTLDNLNYQLQGMIILMETTAETLNSGMTRITEQPSLLLFGDAPTERLIDNDPYIPLKIKDK